MSSSQQTFNSIYTLSSINWTVDAMVKSWKCDRRSMDTMVRRFIDLNQRALDYLGITATIISENGQPSLELTTSKYVGAIPIKSPKNGKIVGDLNVIGRFGEQATELISLLGDLISPEFSDTPLYNRNSKMRPPIFMECCHYIDLYQKAINYKWTKFDNTIKVQKAPAASTLWGEYALRTASDPLQFNIYKNKCNILSTDHKEWRELNYVLGLAIGELGNTAVPIRTRLHYAQQIEHLKRWLRNQKTEAVDDIPIHMSDPIVIKELKQIACKILIHKTNDLLAWRMDYTKFFEAYVQYIFSRIAKQTGARQYNNPHYSISADRRPAWGLSYIEPDLILQKGKVQYVIDAKYKSHLFNWSDTGSSLKDDFRHDFHQVLAYSSFNNMSSKKIMLVYPYNKFVVHNMGVFSPLTRLQSNVYLVGIPIERQKIEEIVMQLNKLVTFDV